MKKIKGTFRFQGVVHETMKFVEEFQLLDEPHWKRFVEQFRIHSDIEEPKWPFPGWRGEYWGKMMRGASLVYAYTRNEELYQLLTESVADMMTCSEENGRLSSYIVEQEFTGWDMWCRKYVLLGMEYYLEICKDPAFAERIIACMKGQADYIISKVGPEEGKIPIGKAATAWRGMNASSILEPMVRLYNLTREERYLSFAKHIVDIGATEIVNIFKLAYEDKFYPYQYPLTKAYEMVSCFEGLLEYYRVTKEPWQKTALINFADRLLETDFTIIGSSGCSHELFDHSTVRQANPTDALMQETCVTVTLMKFFCQMTLLTGNPAYADAFETSFYNAYLGAVNTEKAQGIDIRTLLEGAFADAILEILPFDSYSPLTAGVRGRGIGGAKTMPDHHYYGCCACIGSAGIGLVPQMAVMQSDNGLAVNLYIPGSIETVTPEGQKLVMTVDTVYPREGNVRICLDMEQQESFELALRNPAWSTHTSLFVNGETKTVSSGYMRLEQTWKDKDMVEIRFDMRTKALRPISYGHDILMTNMVDWTLDYVIPVYDEEHPDAKNHVALQRGPLILAADSQLGYDAGGVFDIAVSEDGTVNAVLPEVDKATYPHLVEMEIPLRDGTQFRVTDYGSSGKLWTEESKIAAWIRVQAKK